MQQKVPFFFFCIPRLISEVHLFWWYSPICDRFLDLAIEIVTTCLHKWCMLGVFVAGIYPSRTKLSAYFESMRRNALVYRLDLCIYLREITFCCDLFEILATKCMLLSENNKHTKQSKIEIHNTFVARHSNWEVSHLLTILPPKYQLCMQWAHCAVLW